MSGSKAVGEIANMDCHLYILALSTLLILADNPVLSNEDIP